MKKITFILIIFIGALAYITTKYSIDLLDNYNTEEKRLAKYNPSEFDASENKKYLVFVDNLLADSFDDFESAKNYAEKRNNTLIREKNKTNYIWDNYAEFLVYVDTENYSEFKDFKSAVDFANSKERAFVYFRKNSALLWTNVDKYKDSHQIKSVGQIKQMPELPRGCEVTSLAMLINYAGIKVDKMTLADKISKVPYKDGEIFFGNPNKGFVGDMYDFKKNGLGVYHAPVFQLLKEYLPNSAVDISSADFENILFFVNNNCPVWVIINSTYKELDKKYFQIWNTKEGDIKITNKEHSVLITGYDKDFVYFNDPLGATGSASISDFEKAWIQMGRQAVTVTGMSH